MLSQDIQPTYTCFDDALDFIQDRLKEDPYRARDSLILVHGIAVAVNGPHEGEPYAHAWVEDGSRCIDAGVLDGQRFWYSVEHDEFYAARQIQKTTRYTLREAALENLNSGHYGPWEAEYRALCDRRGQLYGKIPAVIENSNG